MRRFTRWAFGLSAVYHGVMGALALAAPTLAIYVNGGGAAEAGDPYLRALYRGMGAFMVFAALVKGLVARDPDGAPVLVFFGGVLSAITVGTWGLALAAGDVVWAQVSIDVLVQLPVLVAAALYYPRARRGTMDVLELLMTGDVRERLRRERLGEGAAEAVPVAHLDPTHETR
jgi:hypothetical protein